MKLAFSKRFVKDYRRLPASIKKAADKQLERLLSDFHHTSLNTRKMQDPRDILEGRVTKDYRFTFQIYDVLYSLREIGTHDVLKSCNKNEPTKIRGHLCPGQHRQTES